MCCKKISYRCLSQMAQNAQWAERFYIELGMLDEARRYDRIWSRIMDAMLANIKENGVY